MNKKVVKVSAFVLLTIAFFAFKKAEESPQLPTEKKYTLTLTAQELSDLYAAVQKSDYAYQKCAPLLQAIQSQFAEQSQVKDSTQHKK